MQASITRMAGGPIRRILAMLLFPVLVLTACGIPEDAAVRPIDNEALPEPCLLYTSPSPRDRG